MKLYRIIVTLLVVIVLGVVYLANVAHKPKGESTPEEQQSSASPAPTQSDDSSSFKGLGK